MNEELRKALAEQLAELLLSIGWRDSSDAQWSRLEEALPRIADTLKALLERPQGEAVAADMDVSGVRPRQRQFPSISDLQREGGRIAIENFELRGRIRELEEQLAAQPQAKVPEWRPIETAPKDGEHILLYSPERGAFRGFYITDDDGYKPGWKGCYMMQGLFRDEIGGRKLKGAAVTNWMPLPAAPEPPAVAEGNG